MSTKINKPRFSLDSVLTDLTCKYVSYNRIEEKADIGFPIPYAPRIGLAYACSHNWIDLVEYYEKKGAIPDSNVFVGAVKGRNKDLIRKYESVSEYACILLGERGDRKTLDRILKPFNSETLYNYGVAITSIKSIRSDPVMKSAISLMIDSYGGKWNVLCIAAGIGDIDLVREIIRTRPVFRADIFPYKESIIAGRLDILKLLLEYRTCSIGPLIFFSIESGRLDILKYLIGMSGKENLEHDNILHRSIISGYISTIEFCLGLYMEQYNEFPTIYIARACIQRGDRYLMKRLGLINDISKPIPGQLEYPKIMISDLIESHDKSIMREFISSCTTTRLKKLSPESTEVHNIITEELRSRKDSKSACFLL